MRRLLFAILLLLLPTVAGAQCTGIFPNNTVCGNTTGSATIPGPMPTAGIIGTCANNTLLSNVSGGAAVTSCNTLTTTLDSMASSTNGKVLGRSGGTWTGVDVTTGTVTSIAASTGIVLTPDPTIATGTIAIDKATAANFEAATSDKVLTSDIVFTTEVTTTYGTTTAFDFNTFLHTKVTLTGDITTMTCANMKAGQAGVIRFIQDGSGGHTISSWCAEFKWSEGTTPTNTETASAVDVLSYFCSTASFCTTTYLVDVQ